MNGGGASYLAGGLAFLAYVCIFLVLLRCNLKIGWFVLEVVAGMAVAIAAVAGGKVWVNEFIAWYALALYAFLWFCFFFVTSIYSVSVTVGVIQYLYEKPGREAASQEIFAECIRRPFEQRADFLVATGQAQRSRDGYEATPAGRSTTRRIQRINTILGMKSRAFYSQPGERRG